MGATWESSAQNQIEK